jgi:hypothetical protein
MGHDGPCNMGYDGPYGPLLLLSFLLVLRIYGLGVAIVGGEPREVCDGSQAE